MADDTGDEMTDEEVKARRSKLLMASQPTTNEGMRRNRARRKLDNEFLKSLNIQKPIGRTKKESTRVIRDLKAEFANTWVRVMDKFKDFSHFSERQHKFAKYYAENGRTSILNASIKAGYESIHAATHINNGKRVLQTPGFEELVQAFEFERKAKMQISVEDVVKWFNTIATAAMAAGDFTNANRSMESLAKYLGMFVEKKEITHRVLHSKQELDDRIAELTAVLREAEPEIEARLRTH